MRDGGRRLARIPGSSRIVPGMPAIRLLAAAAALAVVAGAPGVAGVGGVAGAQASSGAQEGPVSLEGVVDLHVHAGPDSRPRSVDDIEAARAARDAGLRAILLKNHFTMTADRAALAMGQVEGIEIFGGVVLNRAVGGINPEAVRQMATFSGGRGKVVWLPTFDAEHYVTAAGGGAPYVPILAGGEPLPAVLEVFALIAEHDLTLAMGHSGPGEVLRLIPEAKRLGVRRILVTHVFSQGATRDQMRQMVDEGAILEIDWLAVHTGGRTIDDYVSAIRALGAGAFFLSSDLGQEGNPLHAEGLRDYIRALREAGVGDEEIDVMARRNPARLLGLDPW